MKMCKLLSLEFNSSESQFSKVRELGSMKKKEESKIYVSVINAVQ